jgi:hypothetical protein
LLGERLADCAGTYDCVAHQSSCVSVEVGSYSVWLVAVI